MYNILLLPLISGLIAQLAKFAFEPNGRKFNFKNIVAYSGMPSGHSAIVASLAAITGLEFGLASPLFAISLVFALIVIRDALGIRQYLGQHGKVLNILVKDLREDKMLDEDYPRLLEKIGHTPAQVIAGAAIGILTSVIGYIIF